MSKKKKMSGGVKLQQEPKEQVEVPRLRYSREMMMEVKKASKWSDAISRPEVFASGSSVGPSGRFSPDKWAEHQWISGEGSRVADSNRKVSTKGGGGQSKHPIKQEKIEDTFHDRLRASLCRRNTVPSVQQQLPSAVSSASKPVPVIAVPQQPQQVSFSASPRPQYPAGVSVLMNPSYGYVHPSVYAQRPSLQSPVPMYQQQVYPYSYTQSTSYQQAPQVGPTLGWTVPGQVQWMPSMATSLPLPAGHSAPGYNYTGIASGCPTIYQVPQGQQQVVMPVCSQREEIVERPKMVRRLRLDESDINRESRDEEVPEWVEDGPVDADDTIELRGFDDSDGGSGASPKPATSAVSATPFPADDDSDSGVVEFASNVLNVSLDLSTSRGVKRGEPVVQPSSRMTRFFASHKTPERNDVSRVERPTCGATIEETPKTGGRRLGQAGEELTHIDRPTVTPPVLRQLFANAVKNPDREVMMPSAFGEGVEVDELEREMMGLSSSSYSRQQSGKSTPPKTAVSKPTEEQIRSTRAQLQYGWSPQKGNPSASNTVYYTQPPPVQRFPNVPQTSAVPTMSGGGLCASPGLQAPPPSAVNGQLYAPGMPSMVSGRIQGGMPTTSYGPMLQQSYFYPGPQQQNASHLHLLNNDANLRREFYEFIHSKMQAYQTGTLQESHTGVQAILSASMEAMQLVGGDGNSVNQAGPISSGQTNRQQANTGGSGDIDGVQKLSDQMMNAKL